MNMIKITVSLFGIFLMGGIYWFFFGKKESEVRAEGSLKIKVSGGFKPDIIRLKKGVLTKLIFKRSDPSECLEEFILPDFKIKKYLPLDKEVEVALKPDKKGTFGFHCGMNMYHGKIVVE